MVLLDRDEDEILAAVESGVLDWAWDIACRGSDRRELLIWRGSLLALLGGEKPRGRSEDEVFRSVFPPRAVRTTELQAASCNGSGRAADRMSASH